MNSMIQNDYQQIGQNILQEMEGGFSGPETLPNKIEEPPEASNAPPPIKISDK